MQKFNVSFLKQLLANKQEQVKTWTVDVQASDFSSKLEFITKEVCQKLTRFRSLTRNVIKEQIRNYLITNPFLVLEESDLGAVAKLDKEFGCCRELAIQILEPTSLKTEPRYKWETKLTFILEEAVQTMPCKDGRYRNDVEFCEWIQSLVILYHIEPNDLTIAEMETLNEAGYIE